MHGRWVTTSELTSGQQVEFLILVVNNYKQLSIVKQMGYTSNESWHSILIFTHGSYMYLENFTHLVSSFTFFLSNLLTSKLCIYSNNIFYLQNFLHSFIFAYKRRCAFTKNSPVLLLQKNRSLWSAALCYRMRTVNPVNSSVPLEILCDAHTK